MPDGLRRGRGRLRDGDQARPHRDRLLRDRGNIALARNKYDDAIADYTKSIDLDPAHNVPWNLRGKCGEAKKEYV